MFSLFFSAIPFFVFLSIFCFYYYFIYLFFNSDIWSLQPRNSLIYAFLHVVYALICLRYSLNCDWTCFMRVNRYKAIVILYLNTNIHKYNIVGLYIILIC